LRVLRGGFQYTQSKIIHYVKKKVAETRKI